MCRQLFKIGQLPQTVKMCSTLNTHESLNKCGGRQFSLLVPLNAACLGRGTGGTGSHLSMPILVLAALSYLCIPRFQRETEVAKSVENKCCYLMMKGSKLPDLLDAFLGSS